MIVIMYSQLYRSLAQYGVQTLQLEEGDFLFHCEDGVKFSHLLEKGQMALIRNQPDGGSVILNRILGGDFIAEASIYSDQYHCSCICELPSQVLRLTLADVKQALVSDPQIAQLWATYLAGELQNTRYRCELLTRNKVSQRLSGWLEWHGQLPQKGRWKNLAAELGVSPEALYREIKLRGLRQKSRHPQS